MASIIREDLWLYRSQLEKKKKKTEKPSDFHSSKTSSDFVNMVSLDLFIFYGWYQPYLFILNINLFILIGG